MELLIRLLSEMDPYEKIQIVKFESIGGRGVLLKVGRVSNYVTQTLNMEELEDDPDSIVRKLGEMLGQIRKDTSPPG